MSAEVDEVLEEARRHDRRVGLRRYWARVSLALLLIFVLAVIWRFAGEGQRSRARDHAQDLRTEAIIAKLEREIRADCRFKLRITKLPTLTPNPSPALVDLANDAREAYIEKGCAGAVDPVNGQRFPPAPPTITARPTR